MFEPIEEPRVKITVEDGIVVDVETEISLNVQIVDTDAKQCGEDRMEAFITSPKHVTFDDDTPIAVQQRLDPRRQELEEYNKQFLLSPVFDGTNAIQWKRDKDGLHTNVRRSVIHHSPDGFEISYGGSGPADLALNVMATLFPYTNSSDAVECFYGKVSHKAWQLHQPFKFAFLVAANRYSGTLPFAWIQAWLKREA